MSKSTICLNWPLLTVEINSILREFPEEYQQTAQATGNFQKQLILYVIHHLRVLYTILITDVSQNLINSGAEIEQLRKLVRQGIYQLLQNEELRTQ